MRNLSADTKDALARDLPSDTHCRESLLAGLQLYGSRTVGKSRFFVTQRNAVARLFRSLSPNAPRDTRKSEKRLRIPLSSEQSDVKKPARRCDRVMEARAAFLTCGSASAGARGYHVEFVPPDAQTAERLAWILRAVAAPPKTMKRAGRTALYYKDFEAIVEFFGVIGAHGAVLQLEDLHAVKETKNRIHRLVNTEAANLERVAGAAAAQCETIEFVSSAYGLRHLSPALREIAELRLNHPDESLAELGRRCNPPISKPTVNSRLAALSRLARRLRGETAAR